MTKTPNEPGTTPTTDANSQPRSHAGEGNDQSSAVKAAQIQYAKNLFRNTKKTSKLTRHQIAIVCGVGAVVGGFIFFPYGILIGPVVLYLGLKLILLIKILGYAVIHDQLRWAEKNGWKFSFTGNHIHPIVATFKDALNASKIFPKINSDWDMIFYRGEGDSRVVFARVTGLNEKIVDEGTFIIVHQPKKCPDITIVPSSLSAKIHETLDRHQVTFESVDFNKRWYVSSSDPKSAFDYIDQSTIEYLNQTTFDCEIEFVGDTLIVRFNTPIVTAPGRELYLRWFEGFTRAVPNDLVPEMTLLSTSS